MKKIFSLIAATCLSLLVNLGQAEPHVSGQTVDYSAQGVHLKGYFAVDDAVSGPRPGVLVVHEWWGQNEYARHRARMLAEAGYAALAVDMYGDGQVTTQPDEAKRLSSAMYRDFATAKTRFEAALAFLKQQPTVDPTQVAAIGYCFGGGMVLNMVRQGVPLKGVASFHGSLDPVAPSQPGPMQAKLLVLHGAEDPMVPPTKVELFKQEMATAGADLTFIAYPGATHAFTNPASDAVGKQFNLPVAYQAEADHQSWQALRTFLESLFQK